MHVFALHCSIDNDGAAVYVSALLSFICIDILLLPSPPFPWSVEQVFSVHFAHTLLFYFFVLKFITEIQTSKKRMLHLLLRLLLPLLFVLAALVLLLRAVFEVMGSV